MNTRQKNHATAFRLSLSALMAALGTVLMLSSNLIPVLTYVAPMLASLTLIPILSEFGKKYAWMTWAVTALLALLLCADREAAFFYLFIGWYPILKPALDRISSRMASAIRRAGCMIARRNTRSCWSPTIRVGARILIPVDAFNRWLEEQSKHSTD